jgi:hypothetical protein
MHINNINANKKCDPQTACVIIPVGRRHVSEPPPTSPTQSEHLGFGFQESAYFTIH